MKYTIMGFQQEKLIHNNLDVTDALILRFIKDCYSSASFEFIVEDSVKYMWMNYTYFISQVPIVGTKRNLKRRIEKYGTELLLLRLLKKERNNVRGNFSYIAPTKKLDEIQDFDLRTDPSQPLGQNRLRVRTKSPNKDSSLYDSSFKDSKTISSEPEGSAKEADKKLENEFERFWNLYSKKDNRKGCFAKWKKLKAADKEKIFETLPSYVASTPDPKYRKNPATYLNQEAWNNEIISNSEQPKSQTKTFDELTNDFLNNRFGEDYGTSGSSGNGTTLL